MSTTSTVKPLQTLKGIFNAPKVNHRRDFLRENKLSLRELQRTTTRKQNTQQQEQQHKLQREQDHHQQQQHAYMGRRSASQQRATPAPAAQAPTLVRSLSQQRKNGNAAMKKVLPTAGYRCTSCGCSGHGGGDDRSRGGGVGSMGRTLESNISRGTLTSNLSRTGSCHKEIQTEDIQDELFLYNALKKCSSDFQVAAPHSNGNEHVSQSDPNVPFTGQHAEQAHAPQLDYDEQSCYDAEEQQQYAKQQQQQQFSGGGDMHTYRSQEQQQQNHYQHYSPHNSQHAYHHNENDNPLPGATRAYGTHLSNSHSQAQISSRSHGSHMSNGRDQPQLDDELNADARFESAQAEPPLSGRSRNTLCSTHSQDSMLTKKRSNGSLHKLGNREDVRLPRYLEREKREKEEQRAREMERDPNCPAGHYVLPEPERAATLNAAEKKFKALVLELNRMPMTTETLRIRTRKAEIEKELALLEADIRIFSKPKVYIKLPE